MREKCGNGAVRTRDVGYVEQREQSLYLTVRSCNQTRRCRGSRYDDGCAWNHGDPCRNARMAYRQARRCDPGSAGTSRSARWGDEFVEGREAAKRTKIHIGVIQACTVPTALARIAQVEHRARSIAEPR